MEKDKIIPIFDCPHCGKKDQPASHHGPYIKRIRDKKGRFMKGGYIELHIWSCPACDTCLNAVEDFKPKKWISIEELEAMGWKEEIK